MQLVVVLLIIIGHDSNFSSISILKREIRNDTNEGIFMRGLAEEDSDGDTCPHV